MASSINSIPSIRVDKVLKNHEKLARQLFLLQKFLDEELIPLEKIENQLVAGNENSNDDLHFTLQQDPDFFQKYQAEVHFRLSENVLTLWGRKEKISKLAKQFEQVITSRLATEMQIAHIGIENLKMDGAEQIDHHNSFASTSSQSTTDPAKNYQFMCDDIATVVAHLQNFVELLGKGFSQIEKIAIHENATWANSIHFGRMLEPEMRLNPPFTILPFYSLSWPVQKALERLRSIQ